MVTFELDGPEALAYAPFWGWSPIVEATSHTLTRLPLLRQEASGRD
jgi:hypothetical protein